MKRGGLTAAFFILTACLVSPQDGQDHPLRRFIGELQDSAPQELLRRRQLESAEYRYRSVLSDKYPRVSIGTSAGSGSSYSFTNTKSAAGEGEYETGLTHSAAAGIYLDQEIPGAGRLTLGIKDSITAAVPESGDPIITQSPEFSFRFTQPFAVNGKFIDPRLYSAKYETARLRLEQARARSRSGSNETLLEELDRLLEIEILEREVAYLETKIGIIEEELAILELSLQQGRATTGDVWEKQLEQDTEREGLLTVRHSLEEQYFLLGLNTGISAESVQALLPLVQTLPEITPDRNELVESALLNNPGVRQAVLARQAAEQDTVLSMAPYSPSLTVGISVTPEYAPDGESASTFSDSFSRFGEHEAWTQISGSISVNLPIYPGGGPKYERLSRVSAEEAAGLELKERRSSITGSIDLAFLRRNLELQRKQLYESSLALSRKKREDMARLFELKRATKLDLRRAEMQVLYQEKQLLGAKKEIFMIDCRLLDLAGIDIAERLTKG